MPVVSGRLRVAIDTLQGSYWLIPALMGLAAMVLAAATQVIDQRITDKMDVNWGPWVTTAGADGARAVLTTIAASMMTLASLTYSLTLVALTLAAGQYGPRLLRTFMRDRVTQVSLGTFLATFIYCLAALRTVGTAGAAGSVPHVAVAFSVGMAALGLGYLVYFIHHVASSINATSVIDAVSRELMAAIGSAEPDSGHGDELTTPPELPHTARPVEGQRTGYVTVADIDAMISACHGSDMRIWLAVRPGDFVLEGEPLAYETRGAPSLAGQLRQAIVVGAERTMLQDIEFGVAQLVEVALRALSPGINDPFTALACIDRLGAAFVALAGRGTVPVDCRDRDGHVRVTRLRVPTFDGILRAACDPLRQYARGHVGVLIRLATMLGRVARSVRTEAERAAILRQLEMIAEGARDSVPEPRDRDDVLAAVRDASAGLSSARATAGSS